MANFTTKKNQHKSGNDVQDSPPPYCHTITNVPYSCNHQNNKRPWHSSQEGTGGICLLGDIVNMFVPT
jgi:hypothetical protein